MAVTNVVNNLYSGNVDSVATTAGTKVQPIPPMPQVILKMANNTLLLENAVARTPDPPTRKIDTIIPFNLPKVSLIIPIINYPINIPTKKSELKIDCTNESSQVNP